MAATDVEPSRTFWGSHSAVPGGALHAVALQWALPTAVMSVALASPAPGAVSKQSDASLVACSSQERVHCARDGVGDSQQKYPCYIPFNLMILNV